MSDFHDVDTLCHISINILSDGRMDTWNAALYLGLSRRTLATWRYEKKGPRYIKRGRVFYYKSALDNWLDGLDEKTSQEESA